MHKFDIALIKLKNIVIIGLPSGPNVICMPSIKRYKNIPATITGWGTSQEHVRFYIIFYISITSAKNIVCAI